MTIGPVMSAPKFRKTFPSPLGLIPPRRIPCRIVSPLVALLLSQHRYAMTSKLSWKDSEGLQAIRNVVAKRIPRWKNGLRPFQELPIVLILNGEDVLLCTATGDGKSALFTVPIL